VESAAETALAIAERQPPALEMPPISELPLPMLRPASPAMHAAAARAAVNALAEATAAGTPLTRDAAARALRRAQEEAVEEEHDSLPAGCPLIPEAAGPAAEPDAPAGPVAGWQSRDAVAEAEAAYLAAVGRRNELRDEPASPGSIAIAVRVVPPDKLSAEEAEEAAAVDRARATAESLRAFVEELAQQEATAAVEPHVLVAKPPATVLHPRQRPTATFAASPMQPLLNPVDSLAPLSAVKPGSLTALSRSRSPSPMRRPKSPAAFASLSLTAQAASSAQAVAIVEAQILETQSGGALEKALPGALSFSEGEQRPTGAPLSLDVYISTAASDIEAALRTAWCAAAAKLEEMTTTVPPKE